MSICDLFVTIFGRIRRALLLFSQGRLFALILLVLACLALYRIDDTPLASLHAAQFDRYQRHMPRPRDNQPVIVVEINSSSLAEYGQWPWRRSLVAELVERIQVGAPLVIGLDMLLAERDHYSPESLARQLPALPESYLQRLPDPDERLARALAAGPTVLAVSGVSNRLPGSRLPQKPLGMFEQSDRAISALQHYPAGMTSLAMLEQAAHAEGSVNVAKEDLSSMHERGILRQVPTLVAIGNLPFLSLPLAMVRLALGEEGTTQVEFSPEGIARLRIGAYSLPTLPNGNVLLHFGKADSHYYLSAADVLTGRIPPETFASRLVLIGFNASGLQDRIITPLGDNLPGVDVHVQVIESLLAGDALQRPPMMTWIEVVSLALSGLLLIGLIPAMRPRYAITAFVGLGVFWVAAGYVAFYSQRWLFDASAIVLLLSPVFMTLLGATWIRDDNQRRNAERALQISREEAARVAGELDAARRIQMGLLPNPDAAFAGERRYEVAALLEPARAVGGDYYDCFALDAERMCFVIADVSGKGLPASLFMAVAKTLTSALARRSQDLGQAMREVELELNRDNPELLFVTAFIGVLNAETGQLDFVRAGHDAPLLLRESQTSRLDIDAGSGPPLCVLGDFPYQAGKIALNKGDRLLLFTDGATEASDGQTLFGMERLIEVISAGKPESSLTQQIQAVRDAVRGFEGGHPAADDLTLLLLRWNGGGDEKLSAH